jgi:hypothetical protein
MRQGLMEEGCDVNIRGPANTRLDRKQTRFITHTGGLHDPLGLYRRSDAIYNGDLKADGTSAKSTH